MKKIYLFASLVLFLEAACSMDDVLESGGELNLSVIETNNPIKAEPGEKVVFQFVASTAQSELSRIEISSKNDIKPLLNEVTFAMIDEKQELLLDGEGYFSRPVSTVLVKYPLLMPADETLRGKNLDIRLKVTRRDGTFRTLDQEFEIIRYINNRYGIPMSGKNTVWFYNPVKNEVYDQTDYKNHLTEIDLILYVNGSSKYYCLNPAAAVTETIMWELGHSDYRASEMNTTRFMGGISLNFTLIAEKELAELKIKNGVDQLPLGNNAVCGFMTQSGRKGFAKHLYKSPNRVFVTKLQVTGE